MAAGVRADGRLGEAAYNLRHAVDTVAEQDVDLVVVDTSPGGRRRPAARRPRVADLVVILESDVGRAPPWLSASTMNTGLEAATTARCARRADGRQREHRGAKLRPRCATQIGIDPAAGDASGVVVLSFGGENATVQTNTRCSQHRVSKCWRARG